MKKMKVTQSWHIDYIKANVADKYHEFRQNVDDGLEEILPITPLSVEGLVFIIHEYKDVRRVLIVPDKGIQEAILTLYPETEII